MLYVSIDLETTGLDPNACQVIEFAAVIEDTLNPLPYEELPKFSKLVLHDSVQGELYAVNMNAAIFKELNDAKEGDGSYCEVDELYGEFEKFLTEHNVIDINDRKRRALTRKPQNRSGDVEVKEWNGRN
jgi:DNA polymerase III epsilon subunit-like protein